LKTTEAPLACAFGRALLARQAACPLATMVLEGEAERPRCASPVARTNCETLVALLRERGTFALKLPPPAAPLPHAAQLRVQCGGLEGLAEVAGAGASGPADVHALVARLQAAFGTLADIPFAPVVASMARWAGRPRAGGRRSP
jgi:hypothetical protein